MTGAPVAGLELKRKALDERVRRVAREDAVRHERAELRRLGQIEDARGVIEEAAQRHRVAARVEVGGPLRDLVLKAELPLVAKLEDRGGGELLGDRAGLEHGVHRHRNVPFDVGLAVCFEEQRVVTPDDGGYDAGGAILHNARAGNGVQPLDQGPASLRCCGRGVDQDDRQRK
jgi:hypothetical protein